MSSAAPWPAAALEGSHVSAETSRRLACDAALVVMRHHATGKVLDVGRRRRTVPAPLRRALDRRDRGCRFPGCGLRLCDAHYVEHWADGGATRLDNLVLLCRRHHRAVHEEGFTMELLPGGAPRFRRPDGRLLPEAPAHPAVTGDAGTALARQLTAAGVVVDAEASLPTWAGEPFELSYAVGCLRGSGAG